MVTICLSVSVKTTTATTTTTTGSTLPNDIKVYVIGNYFKTLDLSAKDIYQRYFVDDNILYFLISSNVDKKVWKSIENGGVQLTSITKDGRWVLDRSYNLLRMGISGWEVVERNTNYRKLYSGPNGELLGKFYSFSPVKYIFSISNLDVG